ncbi:MAG: VTT domain-containing protein [Thermodesulfovibrionales bacterium]
MEHSSRIKEFLQTCENCGRCKRVCPFLDTYGTPDKIISETPEKVFFCSNCKACDTVCKERLNPSDALFETKSILLRSGNYTTEVRNALNSASGYAMRGHKFPFVYYSSTDTVFWPGCGVAGTSPEIVKKTILLLNKHLNKKVGLVLDCCFDPLYQLGDVDSVKRAAERIQERLEKHKVKHLITGCTNCRKTLSIYLKNIKVEHIFEVLNHGFQQRTQNSEPQTYYLHHPCPSFRSDKIRQNAKTFLQSTNGENSRPTCCGHGGGISSLSPELSKKFTDKVINASKGNTVITYCMGCKGKFLENGKKAYHLLELIAGVKPIEQPVSSGKKWINRFILATAQRFNLKKLLFGITVVSLIFLTTYLRREGYISTEGILNFIKQYKVMAPLLFILIYSIGPSLFIPSLPLTLGAGFLWGPFWGVMFAITGATAGSSVAFLISRYLMADTIKRRFGYEKWKWLKEKVEKHGWKAVAFARLLPILPFPVLNYMFGVTPISFLHYLWATFVFMLPACIAYVAFGSSMGELILKGNIKGLIIGIIIASIAFLLPFALKPIVKKVSSQEDTQE